MVNILNKIPFLNKIVSNTLKSEIIGTVNIIPDSKASSSIVPQSKGETVNQQGEPSKSFFSIQYFDYNGDSKQFNFALLPAINPGIQGASGIAVPGAGPGIKISSKMKHRSITIPGSTPVIQTIGVENTTIELVGIFTGFEKYGVDTKAYVNDERGYGLSSEDISAQFRYNIVESGIAVGLSIKASSGYIVDETGSFVSDNNEKAIRIETKIIVTNFEQLIRQYDKSYYYIKAFIVSYPTQKRKDPKDSTTPKPVGISSNQPKTINEVKQPESKTPAAPAQPTTPDPNKVSKPPQAPVTIVQMKDAK